MRLRAALLAALLCAAGLARAAPSPALAEACAAEKAAQAQYPEQNQKQDRARNGNPDQADVRQAASPALGPDCSRFAASYQGNPPGGLAQMGPDAVRDLALTLPAASASARAPDPSRVAEVLARLRKQREAAPLSLWERFRRWLDSLAPDEPDPNRQPAWLKWLGHWLKDVPGGVLKLLFWSVFAVLAAGLVAVAVAELRASGLMRRRARTALAPGEPEPKPAGATAPLMPDLEQIDRLGPEARAGALLRWLIATLVRGHRLPDSRALTNGELARRLPASQAGAFRQFLGCVEPVLYGGRAPEEPALRRARELAGALAAMPPATTPAAIPAAIPAATAAAAAGGEPAAGQHP